MQKSDMNSCSKQFYLTFIYAEHIKSSNMSSQSPFVDVNKVKNHSSCVVCNVFGKQHLWTQSLTQTNKQHVKLTASWWDHICQVGEKCFG